MEILDQTIAGEAVTLTNDLDIVLLKNNVGTLKYCRTLIKHEEVKLNGHVCTEYKYQVSRFDLITVQGREIDSSPFVYYMLNKPKDYISASQDHIHKCVTDLVPTKTYALGRLDKDTTGLLILTNDKSLSKALLLPQNHVSKTYEVIVDQKLNHELIELFLQGVDINNHICKGILEIIGDTRAYLSIDEGKFHQVKRMFGACGYRVIGLKRVKFGKLDLDESLKEGQYRELTVQEIKLLKNEQ